MIPPETINAAKTIWDYMRMNHSLEQADCIMALGSHDLRVAEWAAELYLKKLAPIILMSGGLGNFTAGVWDQPEADLFAAKAMKMGVPESSILIENRSSNSGENIEFSRQLLTEKGLVPESVIVVQKPYMERRAYATFQKIWPGKKLILSSPPISFNNYPTPEIPLDSLIHIITGDLQRIIEYPALGFQIPQEIPDEVHLAFNHLVKSGFNGHLMKN